jgi:diguanylate cyclase (GGDEF)-like protein
MDEAEDRSFFDYRTRARLPLFLKFLRLTSLLTVVFAGWDYLIDADHWLDNLPLRIAGGLLIASMARQVPHTLRPEQFDRLALVFSVCYSLFLTLVLSRLDQGLTLGMPCLSVFLTLSSFLLTESRRLPWLLSVLLVVGLASWAVGLNPLVLGSHLIVLTMNLVSGALLAFSLEATARREFKLEQALARDASTDALTGLLNRRAMEVLLETESSRSLRYHRPLSFILIDIDHFKHVNDTWGHHVGDEVLRHVAQTCLRALRTSDSLGRWGGEEFLALLPETTLEESTLLADRLRSTIEQTPCYQAGQTIWVTISAGLTAFAPGQRWQDTYAMADTALYQAKEEGRNRCVARRPQVGPDPAPLSED